MAEVEQRQEQLPMEEVEPCLATAGMPEVEQRREQLPEHRPRVYRS